MIPVGTTALRLIESAAGPDGIAPFLGKTDIFIYPGHRFAVADGLVTNFHLPRSTLMMLVSALMGPGRIRAIYAHAIAARYRFFSYGDASLLLPDPDDGKVSAARTRLEGMCGWLLVPATHPLIMRKPSVVDETIAWLETGRFESADAEHPDCPARRRAD